MSAEPFGQFQISKGQHKIMKKDNDISLKQDHDDEYLYTIKTICGILE